MRQPEYLAGSRRLSRHEIASNRRTYAESTRCCRGSRENIYYCRSATIDLHVASYNRSRFCNIDHVCRPVGTRHCPIRLNFLRSFFPCILFSSFSSRERSNNRDRLTHPVFSETQLLLPVVHFSRRFRDFEIEKIWREF